MYILEVNTFIHWKYICFWKNSKFLKNIYVDYQGKWKHHVFPYYDWNFFRNCSVPISEHYKIYPLIPLKTKIVFLAITEKHMIYTWNVFSIKQAIDSYNCKYWLDNKTSIGSMTSSWKSLYIVDVPCTKEYSLENCKSVCR